MKRLLISLVFLFSLSACVTETNRPVKKIDPARQVTALIELGIGYIQNREYQRAKDNLSKAIAIDPNSAKAHNMFGLVFQLEGEADVAETYFERAIKLEPGSSMIHNNYGAFLFEQKRYADAIEQFEFAAADRIYAKRALVFENMGVCFLKLKDSPKAEQAFSRSLQLNPSQPRALLELSEIRFTQRDYVNANGLYKRHIRGGQQTARSLWLGIQIARIFNRADEVASYSLALKNIFPASEEYRRYQRSL